jgi:hypothetical protein
VSAVSGDRIVWFDPGAYATNDPDTHEGLANYDAKVAGPLDGLTANTPCDPDHDTNPGMDYDGDGDQDTSWLDIAGTTVTCTATTTALDAGAIQSAAASGTPGTKAKGAKGRGVKMR